MVLDEEHVPTPYISLTPTGAVFLSEEEWAAGLGLTIEQHRELNAKERLIRTLLRLKLPIVGCWLIEWHPRCSFQRRFIWERMPWANERGTSHYLRIGPFFVTHWGNGDPNA